jgi:hypothetical protein
MNHARRIVGAGLFLYLVGWSSTAPAAAPLNPLVELNGNSVSNFLLGVDADAGKIKAWYDVAHDGSAAAQQDYGVDALANMPNLVADFEMPNFAATGVKYNIVNFERGSSGNNSSPLSSADFLQSKLGAENRVTEFSSTFNAGADSAYNVAAVSWFTVVRTSYAVGTGSGTGSTSRQSVFRTSVTGGSTAQYGTAFQDDYAGFNNGGAVAADADLNAELGANARTAPTGNVNQLNNAGNVTANAWYIIGTSWNPAAGAFRSVATQQDGTTILDVTNPTFTDGLVSPHVLSTLGRLITTSTTNINALQGQIAEHLIYGSALSNNDMNSVIDYLRFKYFVAVPSHPGDFDSDGDVDGADFVAWQTNFPKPSGATLAQGDADNDGDVDGADFVVWQTNFPFTPAPGASPVPEPAGFAIGAVALATGCVVRGRRARSSAVEKTSRDRTFTSNCKTRFHFLGCSRCRYR